MSDIITRAKELLDGATPGPWELINGEIRQIQHTPEQCTSIRCDHRWPVLSESWGESAAVVADDEDLALMAAVPEMAQALAEESYEYSIQIKDHTGEWETATYIETHLEEWWESQKHAEGAMAEEQEFGEHCRIVRRRVSPPEVINE